MKPSEFTYRMTERQYREAIQAYVKEHSGIHLPALMSAMPLPRVKPVCHMTISHILLDMVTQKEVIEIVDRYPMSYTVRRRYYPSEDEPG